MTMPAWRTLAVPAMLTFLGTGILSGLGVWQLERLAWKRDLIARVEARTARAPFKLPPRANWAMLRLDILEYRPVTLTGRFLHLDEMHLFAHLAQPRGKFGGKGAWVITPFETADGVVLINRGFVPDHLVPKSRRQTGLVTGPQSLTGLIRRGELQTAFMPDNAPRTNQWYYRDIAAMARHIGRTDTAPFMIDLVKPRPPGGLPQPGETRLSFKNDHLNYALTWFALALTLLGIFAAFAWRTARD